MTLPIYSVRSALFLTHRVLIDLVSTVTVREALQAAFGESFDIGLTQLRNDPQFVGIDGSGVSEESVNILAPAKRLVI